MIAFETELNLLTDGMGMSFETARDPPAPQPRMVLAGKWASKLPDVAKDTLNVACARPTMSAVMATSGDVTALTNSQ